MEGRSGCGITFFFPKKALGLEGRRGLLLPRELAAPAGDSVGWKALAAGLGLNSMALTLKFFTVADVGVRTVLDACELGTAGGFPVGLPGCFCGYIGNGVGTGTGIPALYARWLSIKRWLKYPGLGVPWVDAWFPECAEGCRWLGPRGGTCC